MKDAGEKEMGMTVHYVSNICDSGEIIAQVKTYISTDDSIEEIANKEHQLELEHFPKIIEELLLQNIEK
ncbi:folate-dependent phosphoribosylglycinamide formyltransferase PurN [Alloprevotella rava]|uniref:Folate-dependent phosphoribosylglycinamide formyltransferase PurN n=1 Tax=Alloprevotella rava TaxID=671218 RepID=A0A7W5UNT5_9BACT|nr:folate-dependent phosphoribosylglycinamide formyltransferase PurN [Alloprevotella rava]